MKRQNNCQVSKLEACSYGRYKGIYVTRKVSGRLRNGGSRQKNGTITRIHRVVQKQMDGKPKYHDNLFVLTELANDGWGMILASVVTNMMGKEIRNLS